MKQILFSAASSILVVAGFSAFKAAPNKPLKQYCVISNVPVPSHPSLPVSTLVEVSSGCVCNGANVYYCIVTINSSSVNKNGTVIIKATIPQSTYQTRN